jgi:hypothetical protein
MCDDAVEGSVERLSRVRNVMLGGKDEGLKSVQFVSEMRS